MSFLQKVDLKHVVARHVNIEAQHVVTPNYVRVTEYVVEQGTKPGLLNLRLPGTIDTTKYVALLALNPALYELGEISAPTLLAEGTHQISITVRPFSKDTDWEALEYALDIYVMQSKLL